MKIVEKEEAMKKAKFLFCAYRKKKVGVLINNLKKNCW
jgi:hypothetical protein